MWNARTCYRLLRGTLISTYEHGCLSIAKGAAYSALLAFFPLLATIATILIHARADFVSRQLTRFLAQVLPPGTQTLAFNYFAVHATHPILVPVTGMVVSLLAASGVTISLMEGFRATYRIPAGRPFLHQRIVALLLVVSAAIPALAASVLVLFGRRAEHELVAALGLLPAGAELGGWIRVLGSGVRYLISLGAIAAATTILYRYGPNRPQRWRNVWPGATLATALWLATTMLFGWYVRNIAHYNVMYGSVAAVILLLVWMYVLAVIAFIGCEFNAECEKARRG
jgi:membrane protein